jgi:hypothetical protein
MAYLRVCSYMYIHVRAYHKKGHVCSKWDGMGVSGGPQSSDREHMKGKEHTTLHKCYGMGVAKN